MTDNSRTRATAAVGGRIVEVPARQEDFKADTAVAMGKLL